MKTRIRATNKRQHSLVPVTPFEFESFEVRVRLVTRSRPLPCGISCRNLTVPPNVSQGLNDAVEPMKIFLPSPSPQGHGLMRLHLEARPIADPVAPPPPTGGEELRNRRSPSRSGSLLSGCSRISKKPSQTSEE
jgi:hypothetical protein